FRRRPGRPPPRPCRGGPRRCRSPAGCLVARWLAKLRKARIGGQVVVVKNAAPGGVRVQFRRVERVAVQRRAHITEVDPFNQGHRPPANVEQLGDPAKDLLAHLVTVDDLQSRANALPALAHRYEARHAHRRTQLACPLRQAAPAISGVAPCTTPPYMNAYRRRLRTPPRPDFFGACAAAISAPLCPSSLGATLSLIHLPSHHSTGSTATPCR